MIAGIAQKRQSPALDGRAPIEKTVGIAESCDDWMLSLEPDPDGGRPRVLILMGWRHG